MYMVEIWKIEKGIKKKVKSFTISVFQDYCC